MTAPEYNYSTTEREALGVVWALQKFRGYLESSEIKVLTDRIGEPLRWILNLKSPTGRLAHWGLQLQSYNLNVDYCPGKMNVVADALSRPPNGSHPTTIVNTIVTVDLLRENAETMRTEQLADPDGQKLLTTSKAKLRMMYFVPFQ